MKILAINLRPDFTHILEGKIQKGVLVVERVLDAADAVCQVLDTLQQEPVEEFFFELLVHVKNKKAAAYLGIPDRLVKKIDCAQRDYIPPHEWDNVVSSWLPQFLQVEKDNFYFAAPLECEKRNKSVITGMAAPATYIDIIFNAASAAGIRVKSIEPSCYALLRFLNKWDKECCVMEIWKNATSITGYSPICGMFKINQSLGWSHYLEANGQEELLNSIVKHDYTAYNTYELANTNIPIYLVSDKMSQLTTIIQASDFAARLQELPQIPPEFIKTKLPHDKLSHYPTALGLALTPLHERMVENANPSG